MKQLEEAYEEKKAESNAKEVALPCEAGVGFKKRKEKDNVHRQLEPLRSTWKEKGVTIVSDGWSDPTRKPLINFMATSDKPCLHLVYEMWDSMIEKVKIEIYKKEKHPTCQLSLFYDVVHGILVARWAKNNTLLHCLAHSLNPRYYSDAWLLEDSTRSAPHRDAEISQERMKCFRRLFPNDDEHSIVLDDAVADVKDGLHSFTPLGKTGNSFGTFERASRAAKAAVTP
nr:hAT dimerization domain, ribonuclease H-like domain protein [Tanacetum cinerariifolium]